MPALKFSIGLHSQDEKLYHLIDSAFRSQLETLRALNDCEGEHARELVLGGAFDLVILDLDSNYAAIEQQVLSGDVACMGRAQECAGRA